MINRAVQHDFMMKKIDVTSDYVPLVSERTVATAEIQCPPDNAANVLFKCLDGEDVPWVPGEWHELVGVNLADIQIKGTVGDTVTVIGGTW